MPLRGEFSMRLFAIIALALMIGGCRENEVSPSVSPCARQLYSSFDPRKLDQCVSACIKCDNGVITTCTTSCRLKGAQ